MGNSATNLHDVEVNLTKEQQNFTCMVFICVDFIKLPLKDVLANEIPPEDRSLRQNSMFLFEDKTPVSAKTNLFHSKA